MKRAKIWARGIISVILPFFLLLTYTEALAQFQLRSDGFSALGGTSSGSGRNLLAVGGQLHPIETSSSTTHILNPGFIPTLMRAQSMNPVITSIGPNSAQTGQTLNVTITGANFVAGATAAFSGAGITVNSANVTNATQIAANISIAASALAGSRDVLVTNPDGKSGTGSGLFTVQAVTSGTTINPVVTSPQQVGAEFQVDIAVNEVQNLFGISFVLNYNTTFLDVVTPTQNNVTPGPFLGNDIIFLPTVEEAAGKVNIGITRTAGQGGVNGGGVVALIKFKSLASTPAGTMVEFSISNVAAIDPSSNPIALTAINATLTLTTGLTVWPGDTDNNGIVNQADILPLGLCFGQTGPPRQNASLAWIGQPATPWTNQRCTYADANGDGAVNQADVLPIGLNFGRTHSSNASQLMAKANSISGAASLKPDIAPPQQTPGKEFFIRVRVFEVTDLFGLSFELLYDQPALLQILAVEPDSAMGNDVIFFSQADATAGRVSVGISKKAGQSGVNGAGATVRLKAMLTTQARDGDVINVSLQNVAANNSAGKALTMTLQSSRIEVLITAVASKQETPVITAYRLQQNYPNPFSSVARSSATSNPSTLIRYEIPQAGQVVMKVYNFVGQEVRTLVHAYQQSGSYHISWDGRDEQGRLVPSGIYFYRMQVGAFVETRKMILMR